MSKSNRISAQELLEGEFLEQRARLLEVAAFLDRLDRVAPAPLIREDFRYRALLEMLGIIGSGKGERTARILTALSDPGTRATADRLPPGKAVGAWRGEP